MHRKIVDIPDSSDPYFSSSSAAAAFSKKAIIRPPEVQESIVPHTPIRYVIDSRDRHIERYPSPSQYELSLPHDITNVSSVRLLVADIPFSRYLIHAGNCRFYVSMADPTYDSATRQWTTPTDSFFTAELPYGEYTPQTLASSLSTALSTFAGASVQVTINETSESFFIYHTQFKPITLSFAGPRLPYGPQSTEHVSVSRGDGTYAQETRHYGDSTISYMPQSVARILGFGPHIYMSAIRGRLSADNSTVVKGSAGAQFITDLSAGDKLRCYDPTNPSTHIILTVVDILSDTEFTVDMPITLAPYTIAINGVINAPYRYRLSKDRYIVMKINNVDTNRGVHPILDQSFALIHSRETDLNNEYEEHYIKRFDPALSTLSKLAISFYDYEGNLYDFQNAEHRLELLFTTQSMSRRLA